VFPEGAAPGSTLTTVLNTALALDQLLYPQRLPFDATVYDEVKLLNDGAAPEHFIPPLTAADCGCHVVVVLKGLPFRGSENAVWHVVGPAIRWAPLCPAVQGVMVSHDRILKHYGWEGRVAGSARRPPWHWPEAPPIPCTYLDALCKAAEGLRMLVSQYKQALKADNKKKTADPWEGDDWDALEPQVRQLLRYMRGRDRADLRELCPTVWGKEYLGDNGVTEAARETTTSKANRFLNKREWPRLLAKVLKEPYLVWQ
jgi:hypothetical protein